MQFRGLNVHGYSVPADDMGMQTCGLMDIGNLSYVALEGQTCKEFLAELIKKFGYRSPGEGNILFAVSSNQLKNMNITKKSFITFLLEHPNTAIIHHYKNNAHDPNWVFICMHHAHPAAVKRPEFKNNIDEYQKYTPEWA